MLTIREVVDILQHVSFSNLAMDLVDNGTKDRGGKGEGSEGTHRLDVWATFTDTLKKGVASYIACGQYLAEWRMRKVRVLQYLTLGTQISQNLRRGTCFFTIHSVASRNFRCVCV
jgi:hypothetical protein